MLGGEEWEGESEVGEKVSALGGEKDTWELLDTFWGWGVVYEFENQSNNLISWLLSNFE